MFSPKELEGEVDHSFFDSDGEAGKMVHRPEETKILQIESTTEEVGRVSTENEGQESKESILKNETLEDDLSGLRIQGEPDGHSEWTSEAKEDPSRNNAGKEREDAESGREDSDASSRKSSSLPSSDRSKSRQGSQSEDSSSVRSYSSDSSSEEEDDEAVLKNDDESESDEREKTLERPLSKRHSETPRKSPGKFRNRSRSHSLSSSSSSSSECESSYSGNGRRPVPLHKLSSTQTTSSPRRRSRPSSANQKERVKVSETAESEDTVTDVTPLSTPDISPGQSFDLTSLSEPTVTVAEQEQEFDTEDPSISEVDSKKRRSSDTDGEERSAVLSAGRRVDSVLVISSPSSASSSSCSSRRRKNYSFTNDEVRQIERENQRLLKELSRSSPRLRRGGSARTAASTAQHSGSTTARLYHSALNRQREQQRIQRENLAFLKRLESVKPTLGMTRAEQLADYQRQAGYLGIPAQLSRPPSGKGSRPCSSNSPHKARPETAKPSRSTAPRPAWS